jgi:putative Holliday junction resolvase
MRYLAIDPGEKRTGLAVGDDRTGIVSPLAIITTTARHELLRQIAKAVTAHAPDALVLGIALNMDGSKGPAAKKTRQLAGELAVHLGLKVHLFDERLTSYAAEGKLNQSGLTHQGKKKRRDALAAATLLEDFLAAQKRAEPDPPDPS